MDRGAMTGREISVSRIEPHPANIRDDVGDVTELAESIRVHGVLQPLVAQAHPSRPGSYQLLAGHRRLAAAQLLKLETVPVVVRRAAQGDGGARAVEVMLVENCQRVDLSAIEKAEAMQALRNRGMNATTISRRTGLSKSTVTYYLSFLELDAATRARVEAGIVKAGDAIAAVRRSRRAARGGSAAGRPVHVERPWFTSAHRLARTAGELCAHTRRPSVGGVACGQCWEQAIRDDAAAAAADPEPERLTARQERVQLLAAMPVHTGRAGAVPPGFISARQAADELGVDVRTVERYKHELAEATA
jgi:ParB family chromosome partitioning protein